MKFLMILDLLKNLDKEFTISDLLSHHPTIHIFIIGAFLNNLSHNEIINIAYSV
jgi:hypothetical protein